MSPASNLLFALDRFLLGASLRDWSVSSTCQFKHVSRVSRRCLWLRGTVLSDGYRLLRCRWLGSVSPVSMIRVLAFQPFITTAVIAVSHKLVYVKKTILTTILSGFMSNKSNRFRFLNILLIRNLTMLPNLSNSRIPPHRSGKPLFPCQEMDGY
ncbi:hypothetical protein BKA59DRAFT_176282 [Fusarium tricinctum]|uniref:Uncharacterized protein n=1 Tax=Fusarium tricinctum TaxID=61284 RepID=A0A8K0RYS0_9HYPO|nr:hypothetical protein BKA59DRAFT_176282 [Fusarium tricinctum]